MAVRAASAAGLGPGAVWSGVAANGASPVALPISSSTSATAQLNWPVMEVKQSWRCR